MITGLMTNLDRCPLWQNVASDTFCVALNLAANSVITVRVKKDITNRAVARKKF